MMNCEGSGRKAIEENGLDLDPDLPARPNGTCNFTMTEMLEKKRKRGKSTPAQKFFNSLIKDAAVAARIWKYAKPLDQIDIKKKNMFIKVCREKVPTFDTTTIWRRLGEHLQNRRKYQKDKIAGKRKLKSQPPSTSSISTCKKISDEYKPGDVVQLSSGEKFLGTAVYLGTQGPFSEVVLKTKAMVDIELPEGGTLKDTNLKQLILVKTKWITVKLKEDKVVKRPQDSNLTTIKTTHDSNNSKENRIQEPRIKQQQISAPKPRRDINYEETSSPDSDSDSSKDEQPEKKKKTTLTKVSKKTGVSDNVREKRPRFDIQLKSTDLDFDAFVLMEWRNGSLYWGVQYKNTVTNCVRMAGKIIKDYIDPVACYQNSTNNKVNRMDKQKNPNRSFLVWELEKENDFLVLDNQNKIQITAARDVFVTSFKEKFAIYMESD